MTRPFEHGPGELQPFDPTDPESVLQNLRALERLFQAGLAGVQQMRNQYLGSLGMPEADLLIQDSQQTTPAETTQEVLTHNDVRERLQDTLRPYTDKMTALAFDNLDKGDPRLSRVIPPLIDTSPQSQADHIHSYGIASTWQEAADSGVHNYTAVHLSTGDKDAPRLHSFAIQTRQKFEAASGSSYDEKIDIAEFRFDDKGDVIVATFQDTRKYPRQALFGIKYSSSTLKQQLLLTSPNTKDSPGLQVSGNVAEFRVIFDPHTQRFESPDMLNPRSFNLNYLSDYLQPSLDNLPQSIRP